MCVKNGDDARVGLYKQSSPCLVESHPSDTYISPTITDAVPEQSTGTPEGKNHFSRFGSPLHVTEGLHHSEPGNEDFTRIGNQFRQVIVQNRVVEHVDPNIPTSVEFEPDIYQAENHESTREFRRSMDYAIDSEQPPTPRANSSFLPSKSNMDDIFSDAGSLRCKYLCLENC